MSAKREQFFLHTMPRPTQPNPPDGWHSRGYLPHFDGGEIPQFITFRLADSMPQVFLDRWRKELANEQHIDIDAALRKRIELYLDQGYGECLLRNPRIAESIQNSLVFFDGERYRLTAWVVMPNHAHMLMTPCGGYDLSSVLPSLKSYTANEANKLLGRKGQFWQPESFDRWIRDADHFARVVSYIENNPVKARCVRSRKTGHSAVHGLEREGKNKEVRASRTLQAGCLRSQRHSLRGPGLDSVGTV